MYTDRFGAWREVMYPR